jgi:predicted TIM-barrel fold metal-dependent hydrolase
MTRSPAGAYPSLISGRSSEEYAPVRPGPPERTARAAIDELVAALPDHSPARIRDFLASRMATATVLRRLDNDSGGGFFAVPAEAEKSEDAAQAVFGRGPSSYVIDVQTHLVNPGRWEAAGAEALAGFLAMVDGPRWEGGVDPTRLSGAMWAAHLFGESETNVALLTSVPGRSHENVLTNQEIASCRDLVDRYSGTRRVLTHTIVHPNLGTAEIERVAAWSEELHPAGWKVYTLWDPPEALAPGAVGQGWFLDDEVVGLPFLEAVRRSGPRIVCAHKGIGAPVPHASPAGSSPRDIGPVARLYPDLTFVVYHSGYEVDPDGEEGPYSEEDRNHGVNRLIASLEDCGIGTGSNVYAELGTTWYLALRRPREAAHVLGKLLAAVGEDRILWGTDSIWYGSPQPLIDAFWGFQIPSEMQAKFGYPPLTAEIKQKILWRNAASLYGVADEDLRAAVSPVDPDALARLRSALHLRPPDRSSR